MNPALAIVSAVSVALILATPFTFPRLQRVVSTDRTRLALYFPHHLHGDVNCLTCHHNFLDHRGRTTCIDCHKQDAPQIKLSAEPRFHRFCETCHRERASQGKRSGPVRSCRGCHPDNKQSDMQ